MCDQLILPITVGDSLAMQNRIGEMEVFVRIVECGNFTRAASQLNLTPSAVSKLISRLETRLGASLLLRSTRGIQLTAEGRVFFDRAVQIIGAIDEAENLVAMSHKPRGPLRINSNIPFAQHYLLPLLPGFLTEYPDISIDLVQTDLPIDLIYERADVAFRTGHLPDSSLKSRKLLESTRHVVAAPTYLHDCGTPLHPEDLKHHNCLNFNIRRSFDIWPFQEPVEKTRIDQTVSGNLRVDNGETMRRLAIEGLGVARLSSFHILPDIKAGRLVPVLEDFNPGDTEPLQALYVNHAHMTARIRALIDYLISNLRNIASPAAP